jgi:hypothetical protein
MKVLINAGDKMYTQNDVLSSFVIIPLLQI